MFVRQSCDENLRFFYSSMQCHYSLALVHPHLYTADPEATASMCMRGLDGSNYAIRVEIARLLGYILAQTQTVKVEGSSGTGDGPNSSNISKLSVSDITSLAKKKLVTRKFLQICEI